uniref:Glycosyltransferase family 2 protein n=1 Tax=Roseihalotalea indica TaxID=2867963 RepID=A0AA49GKM9_9BACT|nr:glycosyltransferase family 2 protein [Tunicatimonas sp. TK19036]
MKRDDSPLVSLITINYNTEEHTLGLLKSIQYIDYKNLEIIVVDNGSTNNPEKDFIAAHPEIIFIRSEQNLGFAGGNNLGIKRASGDFLFFINNDTELKSGLIPSLLNRFKADPAIGLISPKILYYGTQCIQYAGYTSLSLTARNRAIGNKLQDQGQFQQLIDTPYGHGAAMMVSKQVIETVGEMPEVYFLYYEELDWCEMIRRNGYKIKVDQSVTIDHKESMSIGKLNPVKSYYLMRNRILFVRRNFSFERKAIFMLYVAVIALPKGILVNLVKIRFQHLRAIVKGVIWNFKHPAY